MFQLIAEKANKLSEADVVLVAVPADTDVPTSEVEELVVVEAVGHGCTPGAMASLPVATTAIGTAFVTRTPCRVGATPDLAELVPDAGPAMILPLRSAETVAGVVVDVRHRGAREFTDEQLTMMAAFADQAALAWKLASTQHRMRELDVIADRERIARDLHDHVIQRLFAAGLSLQGAIPRARSSEVQARLADTVDELQGVISDIRTTIFELHGGSSGTTRLRQRLDEVIAGFSGTGLTINVRVEDNLSLEVIDDGCGMPADVTASGLANMRTRAEEMGGELAITEAPGGGTILRWTAPLS